MARTRRVRPLRAPTLRLDALEDRLAPATLFWEGDMNGLWSAKVGSNTNWQGGALPANGDTLVFSFSPNPISTNDIVGLTVGGIVFQANHIIGGSTPLTLDGNVAVTGGAAQFKLDLAVTGDRSFDVAGGSSLLVSENLSGSQSLTKTGPGTLTYGGSKTLNYTGLTRVSDGTLAIDNTGAADTVIRGFLIVGNSSGPSGSAVVRLLHDDRIADNVSVSVESDGRFDLNGRQETIAGLAVVDGTVTIGAGMLATNGLITLSGAGITSTGAGFLAPLANIQVNASPTSFSYVSGHVDLSGSAPTVTVADGPLLGDFTFDGPVTGTNGLTKAGPGGLQFAGANSYTGPTLVTDGLLLLSSAGANNSGIPGSLTIGDGTGAPGSAVVRLGRNDTIADGPGVQVNADGLLDLAGFGDVVGSLGGSGNVALGSGHLWAGQNNKNTTFGGVMSGSGSFNKQGTGTMTLAGANTWTGSLGVDAGTIRVGANDAIAAQCPVVVLAGATFDLNNRANIVGSLAGAGSVKLDTDGYLTAGWNNTSTSYTGVMSGGGVFEKVGAGTLTLGGANTFTGTLGVSAGTVRFASSDVLADTNPVVVSGGATLDLNNFSDNVGPLSVSDGTVAVGAGVLGVGGHLIMVGGRIDVPTGRLILGDDVGATSLAGGPAVISGTVELGSGLRAFEIADGPAPDDLVIDGAISGAERVFMAKEGPGSLRFMGTAANTFIQSMWVKSGTLVLAKSAGVTAVAGALFVGGAQMGPAYLRTEAADQIADAAEVSVYPDGFLQAGAGVTSVCPLFMTGGTVDVAAGGVLTLTTDFSSIELAPVLTGAGSLNLNGARLHVQMSLPPAVGDARVLLDNRGSGSVTGIFNGLPEGTLFTIDGKPYQITYSGGDGNDVVVTRIPAAVIVSPLSTLVTTEAGGTTTFTVVLGSVPTANVTISLSTSNTAEGTIDRGSLTFTPANALTPQTVTVSGAGDSLADTNVAYQIITTASSADPEYDGLAVADVPVVNLGLLPKGTRTFTDSDGDSYTVRLTGPGNVAVLQATPTGNGPGAIDWIVVRDTDRLKSSLSVSVRKAKTGDGRVSIGEIAGGGLRSIATRASDIVGTGIHLFGSLGGLAVRDILNGADVSLVGDSRTTTIRAHVIGDDTTFDLGDGVASLVAARVGDGQISAAALRTLLVTGDRAHGIVGDFAADVLLSGINLFGRPALAMAAIAGTVSRSTFRVDAGSVGSFRAGRFVDSFFVVGFTRTVEDPMVGGSFVPGATIGSFRVTGYNGLTTPAFADSWVAASTFNNVYLKSVQTVNGGRKFGVLADVQVGSVTVPASAFRYVKGEPTPAAIDDFQVKIF